MISNKLFIYDWSSVGKETDTTIRIFGLTPDSKSCCLHINNFRPRVFIELPTNIKWTSGKIGVLEKYLVNSRIFWISPETRQKVKRRKLYYAKFDPKTNAPMKFPFLLYEFSSNNCFYTISQKLKNTLVVPGLGKIKLTVHESNISLENQLICSRDIQSAGWIEFTGRPTPRNLQLTHCHTEYSVDYRDIVPFQDTKHVSPTTLSFDIETNSGNPNVIPSPKNPADCIFQISCVYWNSEKYCEYLLTLGNPDPTIVGEHVKLLTYPHELQLILGFIDLIHEWNPQVITGYNIFGFDLPYLIDRADHNRIKTRFTKIGMMTGKQCVDKEAKTKTGMEQRFLLTDGRLWIDLMHMVQRDFKLPNYKLDTVAEHFLGAHKDPVSYQDIFRSYREGVSNPTKEGVELLGIVAKYCVKDAVLVKDLFEKLDVWNGLIEMAAVCNVPPSTVFTMGQQSKVFAQVYRHCFMNNIVIDNTKEMNFEELDYTGAMVITPNPGIYENVVPFDFASLYPSLIIAYNIDYSTLVPDDLKISDDRCHIIQWEEHVKCEHCEDHNPTSSEYQCQKNYFRFLKEPIGVLPAIIQNLLALRKETRTHIKELTKEMKKVDEQKRKELEMQCSVLNKRQLSYKIASNSMYGALGVKPSKAVLPFMPGASSITAMGRANLQKAIDHMQKRYNAKLVYGDTDSTYVQFPHVDRNNLWSHSRTIEKDLVEQNVFPEPMKLEFENAVYADFLIRKKKKYMWKDLNEDGTISDKIGKKGVLTARRDNSQFIRTLYEDLVKFAFNRKSESETMYYIVRYIIDCLTRLHPQSYFVVTKSVKSAEEYKVRLLPNDPKKRKKRLEELDCPYHECDTTCINPCTRRAQMLDCYTLRSLPSHVQLAAKMRARGVRVDTGQRIGYVITEAPGKSKKLFDKIEDQEYQATYSSVIQIDYMHYIKQLCPPLDQLLYISFQRDKIFTTQYKIFVNYHKVLLELKKLYYPVLKFKKDPSNSGVHLS